jgi:predicted transcriptional regulator
MKYRSRVEMLAQILEIAHGNDVNISEIIRCSKIRHKLLKQYLPQLTTNGLQQPNEGIDHYPSPNKELPKSFTSTSILVV